MGKLNEIQEQTTQSWGSNSFTTTIKDNTVEFDSAKDKFTFTDPVEVPAINIGGSNSVPFTSEDRTKLDNLQTPMQIKGRVDSVAELPTEAEIGDTYLVGLSGSETFDEYVCVGVDGSDETAVWESVGTTQVQSDWNQNNATAIDFIKNKPNIWGGGTGSIAEGNPNNKAMSSYSHTEGNQYTTLSLTYVSASTYSIFGNYLYTKGASVTYNDSTGTISNAVYENSYTTLTLTISNLPAQNISVGVIFGTTKRSSHNEGEYTQAQGISSHAEGQKTIASNQGSHAEGCETVASGQYGSHAEGRYTTASGQYSHVEGYKSIASGNGSHAEGDSTNASSYTSHTEGYKSVASGNSSHAEGVGTIANHLVQHVFGQYNVADDSTEAQSMAGNYIEIVGNGSSESSRSNARTLDWDGNEVLAGSLTAGTNLISGSSSSTIPVGDSNTILSSDGCTITSSASRSRNSIISSGGASIVAGSVSAIIASQGMISSPTGTNNVIIAASNATLAAGTNNIVSGANNSCTSSGSDNVLFGAGNQCIAGNGNLFISYSGQSTGSYNFLMGTSPNSIGSYNLINGQSTVPASNCFVWGGYNNFDSSTSGNFAIGSGNNFNGSNNFIFGSGNTIGNGNYGIVILGRSGTTATSNNTVYMSNSDISGIITLGSLQIKDDSGVLKVSDDGGTTWKTVTLS